LYYNKMENKYLTTEKSSDSTLNPSYVEMAASGFDFVKNITNYNDDIAKSTQDYKDGISQANINIAKLEPIQKKVSTIIAAAQARRNNTLVEKLGLSLAEIQSKYKDCFAEENNQFYDTEIVSTESSYERCTNGYDDDLNGLTDSADPACASVLAAHAANGGAGGSNAGVGSGNSSGGTTTTTGTGGSTTTTTTTYSCKGTLSSSRQLTAALTSIGRTGRQSCGALPQNYCASIKVPAYPNPVSTGCTWK